MKSKVMKPCEIISSYGYKSGHSEDMRVLNNYFSKPCIFAIYESPLGTIFLMKGKIKYFSYLYYGNETISGRMSYPITRIYDSLRFDEFNKAIKIIEKHGKILDHKMWDEMNAQFLVEQL